MGWNGSGAITRTDGTRTGATVWTQAKNASVAIKAADHDTHDEDIVTAIENCVARDGQNAASANLPMGGFKHTNVAASAARTDYARTSDVQDSVVVWGGTGGGTANAQTITLSPAITAYATGQRFAYVAALNNTAAATLNVNSVGAKNLKKIGGGSTVVDVQPGDILSANIIDVVYDGTQFIVLNPNTNPGYAGTAAAAGSNQGTATLIDFAVSVVTAADGAKGILLPSRAVGSVLFIGNQSTSALLVYPPSGWSFAAKSANASISIPANAGVVCFVTAATQYCAVIGATF